MTTMRAIQVPFANGEFELVERPLPEPGLGEVRIRVQACGICHSDAIAKEGHFPNMRYPLVPGHEVAGIVDALGTGVTGWEPGTRVGVGWFGGNCGICEQCRRGDLVACQKLRIPGVNCDGGYAEAMIAPVGALVRIPADVAAEEAAPLLCAGVTTFNALRRSIATPGDLVAVLGLGGLGHLGVQFASKMGFETVAVARGREREPLARELGASHYIDSAVENVGQALTKLGTAKVILATAPNSEVATQALGGISRRGTLIVVGIGHEPLVLHPRDLIRTKSTIVGHGGGTPIESEDTLRFSTLSGVRAAIEKVPLERAAEAYERMMSGKARFRMVLTTGL